MRGGWEKRIEQTPEARHGVSEGTMARPPKPEDPGVWLWNCETRRVQNVPKDHPDIAKARDPMNATRRFATADEIEAGNPPTPEPPPVAIVWVRNPNGRIVDVPDYPAGDPRGEPYRGVLAAARDPEVTTWAVVDGPEGDDE